VIPNHSCQGASQRGTDNLKSIEIPDRCNHVFLIYDNTYAGFRDSLVRCGINSVKGKKCYKNMDIVINPHFDINNSKNPDASADVF